MNIANKITLFRVLAVPLVVVLLYQNKTWTDVASFILFTIASFSDFFDGYLARKYNLVTDFGKVLDPIADKIMITCCLVVLVHLGRVEAWIVAIMISRDLLVGAIRDLSASKGVLIPAGFSGKAKTVVQMVAVGMLMYNDELLFNDWLFLSNIVIYIALVLTVYSGYDYISSYLKRVKQIEL